MFLVHYILRAVELDHNFDSCKLAFIWVAVALKWSGRCINCAILSLAKVSESFKVLMMNYERTRAYMIIIQHLVKICGLKLRIYVVALMIKQLERVENAKRDAGNHTVGNIALDQM